MTELSRRGLLAGAAATLAGTALADRSSRQTPRSLRVAFMTDVHMQATKPAAEAFARCLKRIHSLKDKPDFIIQGGDIVYDALQHDAAGVEPQFQAAAQVLGTSCSLPIEHVIGNHDIFGWLLPKSHEDKGDPRYGKKWWLNWTGYDSTYRSIDRGGWHFIFLDSMSPASHPGYQAKLDDAQMKWLVNDLRSTPPAMPICLVSHIPILSAASLFFGPAERPSGFSVPSWLMHADARRLKDLFSKHSNVQVCLSGHTHMCSRVDYAGVKHFGFGAVCGAWWKGPMQETAPGFGIVDLFRDGNVRHYYVTY